VGGISGTKDVMMLIYLEGFQNFRGPMISTLFTPRRARIGSLLSGGANAAWKPHC
jgi:hypothetical protein